MNDYRSNKVKFPPLKDENLKFSQENLTFQIFKKFVQENLTFQILRFKSGSFWTFFGQFGPPNRKNFAPSARFPLVKSVFMNPETQFFRAFGAISPCKIGIYNLKSYFFRAFGAIFRDFCLRKFNFPRFQINFDPENLTFYVFKKYRKGKFNLGGGGC